MWSPVEPLEGGRMIEGISYEISSAQNPKIKAARKLWDRRQRDKTQQFLIEGYRELLRAAESQHPLDSVLTCPGLYLGTHEEALLNACKACGADIFFCSEAIFRSLSYRDRPDGLLAVAPQQHRPLGSLPISKMPFYVIAEAIEKPGNLGTILRSSDAVGLDGVIICDRCTDIHNPNVVRASVGTLFTVPVVEAESEETLQWLKDHHIAIVAATPAADVEFTQVDLCKGIAIAVGTEQLGLSKRWMEAADVRVKIPMLGAADSLNVAMATTLLLYEALRQRQQNV